MISRAPLPAPSVIVPGDVVEVEVDAPDAPGAPTSGRLVTTVTQGDVPFDGDLGSLPAVDDLQRTEAWGSAEAAGLAPPTGEGSQNAAPTPADAAIPDRFTPSPPSCAPLLLEAPTAGLSAQLRKRGHHSCFIDGVSVNIPGSKIVGTAKTLRFVPFREDLFAAHGGGYNAQKRAFDAVEDGEIIVIEARGDATRARWATSSPFARRPAALPAS